MLQELPGLQWFPNQNIRHWRRQASLQLSLLRHRQAASQMAQLGSLARPAVHQEERRLGLRGDALGDSHLRPGDALRGPQR